MDVVVDGSLIRTERDFHQALFEPLEFGEYYGWNLAALWDRLSADVPRPVRLVWNRSAESRSHLGEDEFLRIVEVLDRTAAQDLSYGWEQRFDYVLL